MEYHAELAERRCCTNWKSNIICPMHIHKYMEMVLVTDGVLTMQIKSRIYHMEKGCAVFVEPYDQHAFQSQNSNTCNIIEFSPETAPLFFEWLKNHAVYDRMIRLPQETYAYLLSQLPGNICNYTGFDIMRLQAVLMPLCQEFMTRCRFQLTEKKYDDTFIEALNIITQNPARDLSQPAVAKQLGIRPDSLSRLFSEKADMTFLQYVQYLRVSAACAMMCRGKSITDAAYEAGFGSICTFNRVFRQQLGCTPREFMKVHAKRNHLYDWDVTPLFDNDLNVSYYSE